MQIEGTMRLGAVQKDRDAGDRQVRCDHSEQGDLPPGGIEQPVRQYSQQAITESRKQIHSHILGRTDGFVAAL